jgi:leucyl-tRNA synthetase
MQRNWIGKSTGIEIEYQIKNSDQSVVCFTTRPDTNFGATFIVLAPDHPLVDKITSKEQQAEVDQYVEKALNKTEQERKASKEKTGVFTGCYAVNNLNGEELPIYVADFVLMDYGTGAVVGVPGHDLRDFEFAQAMELPVKRVVVGPDQDDSEITSADQVQEETGTMVNSEFLNGMDIHQATKEIMDYFEEKGWGRRKTTYKLRDWCISRQRYWGPPIPMIYCEHCAQRGESWFTNNPAKEQTQESVIFNNQKRMELAEKMAGWYPVAKKDLPVELPFIEEYQPKGQGKSPLAERKDFYKTECPRCGKAAVRETDVSDTFLDSSWYFFRYPSTECQDKPFDKQRTDKWLPVDMYIGGNEHAVLHLMYTRFITMFLHDLGMIDFVEPFKQFVAHGLIIKDGAKMSKSRGNVINPTEYMDKYGADALRMYMLFLGPYQQGGDFRDTGMVGMYKFLARVYRLAVQAKECEGELNKELSTKLHQTIKKMGEDFSSLDFNTAIAALMELVNVWQDNKDSASREVVEVTARLIAPVAPHLGEELWEMAGKEFSVVDAGWPKYDAEIAQEELVEVVVQVDGKIRDKFQMKHEQAEEEQTVLEKAKQSEKIAKYLKGEEPDKVFFVPGKLINLVVDNG